MGRAKKIHDVFRNADADDRADGDCSAGVKQARAQVGKMLKERHATAGLLLLGRAVSDFRRGWG